MSQNNENLVLEQELEELDDVCNEGDDLQVVMQGGVPVSVIISIEEFDKMTSTIEIAEELLEGKDLFMPDGTKVTFQEMVSKRIEQERVEYEAYLASMSEDESEEEAEENK